MITKTKIVDCRLDWEQPRCRVIMVRPRRMLCGSPEYDSDYNTEIIGRDEEEDL